MQAADHRLDRPAPVEGQVPASFTYVAVPAGEMLVKKGGVVVQAAVVLGKHDEHAVLGLRSAPLQTPHEPAFCVW